MSFTIYIRILTVQTWEKVQIRVRVSVFWTLFHITYPEQIWRVLKKQHYMICCCCCNISAQRNQNFKILVPISQKDVKVSMPPSWDIANKIFFTHYFYEIVLLYSSVTQKEFVVLHRNSEKRGLELWISELWKHTYSLL